MEVAAVELDVLRDTVRVCRDTDDVDALDGPGRVCPVDLQVLELQVAGALQISGTPAT